MTPPDLAALAREWMRQHNVDGGHPGIWPEREKSLVDLLTLSRTAGRAEGLMEASDKLRTARESLCKLLGIWDRIAALHPTRSYQEIVCDVAGLSARIKLVIRALASDPAPGEQCPIGGHPDTCSAGTCAACHAAYKAAHPVEPAPGEQAAEERRAIADEARRYASHYPQSSDGRNTFILLAEWVEARK